ncbi:hypothetical protein ACVILL_007361 [Bradyrhizobium sp. USDA 3364]
MISSESRARPSPPRNPYQYVSLGIAANAGGARDSIMVEETSRVAAIDSSAAAAAPTSRCPPSICWSDAHPGGLNVRAKNTGALAFFNR